jgi:hypothetical protein
VTRILITLLIAAAFVSLLFLALRAAGWPPRDDDIAVRLMPRVEWPAFARVDVEQVPVSPTLYHLDGGRVPKPVVGRAVAPVPEMSYAPRHAAPETVRAPRVLVARLNLAPNWRNAAANLTWSTL